MEQTITYRVPDMSTGHCKTAIAEKLRQVPGVDSFDARHRYPSSALPPRVSSRSRLLQQPRHNFVAARSRE